MTDRIEHLDEGTIHAWLDGELSPDESARVESHANSCADCAALVAEARGLVAASSRILASLDAVPAGVVPGSGKDQLAALRARRQAASRVWWRDRRFVAAASLLLVAGVSSVVWRNVGDMSPVTMESAPAVDSATQPTSPPTPAPAVAPTEASSLQDAAPTRVLTRRADSATSAKVAAAGPVPGAVAESRVAGAAAPQRDVANAARARDAAVGASVASSQQQAVDSTRAAARAEQSAFERKVRQQVQTPPTPPRIIPEQRQQGATNAPPPQSLSPRVADTARVTSGAGAATRMGVTAASISAGARVLDPDSPAGGCYAISTSPPDSSDRLPAADTVVLLDMPSPGSGDPAWFLARPARGAANAAMRWRQVDSVTVELRTSAARDSSALRFQTRGAVTYQGGGQVIVTFLPDVRNVPGVRAKWAMKVRCP